MACVGNVCHTDVSVYVVLFCQKITKRTYSTCVIDYGGEQMNMKNTHYSVKLLLVGKSIQQGIDSLTYSAKKKASNTHCICSSQYMDTMQQIHNIQQMLESRDILQYLQNSLCQCMQSMSEDDQKLMHMVYVCRSNRAVVAEHMGYSVRTLYRRLAAAEHRWYKVLDKAGISYQWLKDNIRPICDLMY